MKIVNIILTIAASLILQLDKASANSLDNLVGLVYKDLPPSIEKLGGSMLNHEDLYDSTSWASIYSTSLVRMEGKQYLLLEILGDNETVASGDNSAQILSYLPLEEPTGNTYYQTRCDLEVEREGFVVALLEANLDENRTSPYDKAVKAWEVDLTNQTFNEISPEGISCYRGGD